MFKNEEFQQWISSQEIEKRSLQSFKQLLDIHLTTHSNKLASIFDDFNKNSLIIILDTIDLRMENPPVYDGKKVVACLSLFYNQSYYIKNGKKKAFDKKGDHITYIGSCRIIFDLTGKIEAEEITWWF